MKRSLKVIIVDDTITYRTILRNIVSNLPNIEVVATAVNGKAALEKLKNTPTDLVLLDIEMPEMDGIETLMHIRKDHPSVTVVMVSGISKNSADITIQALQKGAIDFISKPESESIKQNIQELQDKLSTVFKHLRPSKIDIQTEKQEIRHLTDSKTPPTRVDILAIGASTGGPTALTEILQKLPENLNIPILVVQHMPPVFTASLAHSLDKKSKLKIKEAAQNDLVEPNTVYIAPGGSHMIVCRDKEEKVRIALNNQPPEHSCRPAVDVLFRSIAAVYKKNILSLILTGMGSDGALGVQALKQCGAYSITQSEKSCVVYGMPQAVVKMNLSDEAIALENIANRITNIVLKK